MALRSLRLDCHLRAGCRQRGTYLDLTAHSSLWEVGKTTHERRSDAYEVNRPGMLRPELLTPWAAIRIRLQNRKPGKGSISLTSAFGFERNITATDLSDLSI
jgi:hypothetical protein